MLPPHRVTNHEVDTEACKIVSMKFDRNWEIRDVTGRDFGIDKIVERFENGRATSEMLILQIKGTETLIDSEKPSFYFQPRHYYMRNCLRFHFCLYIVQ